jgi:hypothetical protein
VEQKNPFAFLTTEEKPITEKTQFPVNITDKKKNPFVITQRKVKYNKKTNKIPRRKIKYNNKKLGKKVSKRHNKSGRKIKKPS